MKRPIWALVTGIFAIVFGVANGWIALVDLSQVKTWESLNAMFAPAQQAIAVQGVEASNFVLGLVAPPLWFVQVAVRASWVGIVLGVLFIAAGVGLLLYRRSGMQLLALALTANIVLQAIYSAQAVRSMSVQAIVIPARAAWIIVFCLLFLLVIGIGSLRWFRFGRPAVVEA
jgi:hypothetical protein